MREPHALGGFVWLTITALCWGLNWPVMKLLMQEWPPFSFRIIAGGGAILLLFGIARWQGDPLLPRSDQWGRLVVAGFLNISAWSLVAPLSLFWLNASEAAIIAYTMPIWATVLAWPFLNERPTWQRVAGLCLGLAGVLLLMGGQLASVPAEQVWAKLPGAGFIMLTALMFAAGTVFTKRFPIQMAPVPLVGWQLLVGLSPVVVVGLGFERIDWSRVTAMGWGCLVYVGGIAQVLAYLAWFRALKRLPASTAALGSLLVPVIGVVSSGLLLGEPLGLRHYASLVLTLGGVVLAARA